MNVTTQEIARITIEPAGRDDIVAAAHVYQAAAEALSDKLRSRNPWTSPAARAEDLQQAIRTLGGLHANDHRSVIVARDSRDIVGMAAVHIHGPHAHIAFFFVHPNAQNRGTGRRLLDHLREFIAGSGATAITLASSRDPKAWQRYLRFGLYPGPPVLPFRSPAPTFPATIPKRRDLVGRSLMPADLDLVSGLDKPVRGADRRDRIAHWLADGGGGSIVTEQRSGAPVGYALVSMRTHHGQIGPVVSTTREHFPYLLDLALSTASGMPNPDKRPWRVDLSARNHVAIAPLLAAGFSVENLVSWFESEPIGQWDRYIFRDEDEL